MAKTNKSMKSGIFAVIILALLIMPMVSAKVQYYQYKTLRGNNTIYNYDTITLNGFIDYDKNAEDSLDYIKKNNPFEFYVSYRFYLNSWNDLQNNSRNVEYCNLTGIFLPANVTSLSKILFSRTFYLNESDSDASSNKFFFSIQDNEAVRIEANCKFREFQSLSPVYDLDMPLDYSIVMPSWNCKACQLYEWSKQQITISKATTLDDYTSNTISFTKRLFQINYEIITILFWIFTFVMFYIAITLLFTGAYWGYLYIKKWTNSI